MIREYGWFAYALVDTEDWMDDGAALRERLRGLPGVAPESGPGVHRCGRLGVIASTVPLDEYAGPNLDANLENLEWLECRVRTHAAVIAEAFDLQPVLPLRFGTLFSSLEAMCASLGARGPELLAKLLDRRGQEEWTVRFCANPDRVAEQMAQAATEGTQAGSGAQYLLRRKMALQGRSGAVERLFGWATEGHRSLERLALHSAAVRAEISGLPDGARSLLSRIYTIRQSDRLQFLEELGRIGRQMAHKGLATLHSGPWPPGVADSPSN